MEPLSVFEAIPKISSEIAIKKAQSNQGLTYKFRGIDDVYAALNPMLSENGIYIYPEVIETRSEIITPKENKIAFRVLLTVKFHITDTMKNEIISTVVGEAIDYGDKATPKALSMAYKYMAFQVFCIPTEERMDTENEDHGKGFLKNSEALVSTILKTIEASTDVVGLDSFMKSVKAQVQKLPKEDTEKVVEAYTSRKQQLGFE